MKRYYFILYFVIPFFISCQKYHFNEGYIHGTIYHIKYKSATNYQAGIEKTMKEVDLALSTFEPNSVISLINKNQQLTVTNPHFIRVFNKAIEISEITGGAFDITVAPLVNLFGFGFESDNLIDSSRIAEILKTVGYKKVKLVDNKLIKEYSTTMLDCSAIAKGYSVDLVSEYLEKQGVENYMVEIGGEVRAKGKNQQGEFWKIGIDKPIDDVTGMTHELQEIVTLQNRSVATSGNYRQFYEKDGIKYAHTINPFTGKPALSNLLSASVFASDCMTADAFATAFMVLGIQKSIELSNKLPYIDVYFIFSDSVGKLSVYYSAGLEKLIIK